MARTFRISPSETRKMELAEIYHWFRKYKREQEEIEKEVERNARRYKH
jgi:hypothetical protein